MPGASASIAAARALAGLAALVAALGLGGCSSTIVYRIEVQQGNFLSQETVSQLKPGMTKDQVRFLLGTPLVTDIFHAERWDYVYTRRPARSTKVAEERRLTLFFDKSGLLERVEGDVVPSGEKPGPTATR